jgi:uncharacterized protein DUF4129
VVAGAPARLVGAPGIGRQPAQQLARRELARSLYRESLWQRLWNDITRWLNSSLGGSGPGRDDWWTLIALIVVAVLVVAGIVYWTGPARRSRRQRAGAVLAGDGLTAADYRQRAGARAEAGDYATAIIEQVRAIALELEARGVVAPRPGRTAAELAAEASGALPGRAEALRAAAVAFDDVRYGGRPGSFTVYQQVRDLDMAIIGSRGPAVPAGSAGPAGRADDGTGWAEPPG